MSNDLITTGGGAVVPASTGGAVGEHIGDISLDRGASTPSAPAGGGDSVPARWARYMRQGFEPLMQRLGLSEQQRNDVEQSLQVMMQNRKAVDEEDKLETQAALLEKWGKDAYAGNIQTVHEFLIDVCGGKEAADRVVYGRDATDGRGITCDAPLIEGLLAYARKMAALERAARTATPARGDPPRDVTAIDSARRREIEGWMGAPRGSADYARYWQDPKVQAELRGLIDKGARNDVAPRTADTEVERRIAEIESWMGTRKYTEPVQAELRELYDRRAQRKG